MIFRKPQNQTTELLKHSSERQQLIDELEQLQEVLAELTAEREDLLRLVNEFEVKYHLRLGQHIQRILELRRDRAAGLAKSHPEFEPRYQEAVEDYNSWNETSSTMQKKKLFSLSEDDLKLLKKTFRKAAGKCHPDVARGDDKERSLKFFVSLRQAYERNDLDAVVLLAEQIDSEQIMQQDPKKIEIESLQTAIKTIEKDIAILHSEIRAISESESYRVLAVYADVDVYFQEREKELLLQIDELMRYTGAAT